MPNVFVVQMPHVRVDGRSEPKYDIGPAAMYGEIQYLLGPTASPHNSDEILDELHDKLSAYTGEDWIVCLGSPVLIGWAIAVAAHMTNGDVSMLQWSSKEERYLPIRANIWYASVREEDCA